MHFRVHCGGTHAFMAWAARHRELMYETVKSCSASLSVLCQHVSMARAPAHAQELMAKVVETLTVHPPLVPSRPAVQLLVGVGRLQHWLSRHDLLPQPGRPSALDATAAFQPHIQRWIRNSKEGLAQRCRRLEHGACASDIQGTDADGQQQGVTHRCRSFLSLVALVLPLSMSQT